MANRLQLLRRIEKLIALTEPLSSGEVTEEAKSAALQVCALIRSHRLSVWNPKFESHSVAGAERRARECGELEDLNARYAAAVDANPVRVAMRRRQQEREAREHERRTTAHLRVGDPEILR